jgi:DNA-binding response OmpR family regulator
MVAGAKRILAVEDDQDILERYHHLFKDAGYEVSSSVFYSKIRITTQVL